ncbi:acylphosphatase [Paracoccus sp. MBLB3053]|uniref:Acylphosphatase n=1 Tax=Paracoccus aurantius TaxID=3073814 RepID=A0ABU2HSY8_9RHOB|nr:acylphosphatase [Paracoccus sp. MBLB3053]MDS9467867.1 acylphosphatase [Paracoccus sp. MBLB3053]
MNGITGHDPDEFGKFMTSAPAISVERFVIMGQLAPAAFRPWISRHAGRLGLGVTFLSETSERIDISVKGPPDLIDAMEMGCTLGPAETWVETIERHPVTAMS